MLQNEISFLATSLLMQSMYIIWEYIMYPVFAVPRSYHEFMIFFSHDALDDIISCSVFLRFCYFQLPVWQFFVLHHLSLLMFYLRLIHYFCFLHHYNHLVNIVFTRWSRFLFAYFSKYLQTKTIAWKGDCVISLQLQMLQRWSKPF